MGVFLGWISEIIHLTNISNYNIHEISPTIFNLCVADICVLFIYILLSTFHHYDSECGFFSMFAKLVMFSCFSIIHDTLVINEYLNNDKKPKKASDDFGKAYLVLAFVELVCFYPNLIYYVKFI